MKGKPASLQCLQRPSRVARIISYCDLVHLIKCYYRSFVAFSRPTLHMQPTSSVCSTPLQLRYRFKPIRRSIHLFFICPFISILSGFCPSVCSFVHQSVHPFRRFSSFRPFFAVSVHTSVCTTFLSILRPCIRCSVSPVSIFLRARCFAFIYPFVFSSVLSFAFDRLTCPFLRSISHLPLHLFGHSFTHCSSVYSFPCLSALR